MEDRSLHAGHRTGRWSHEARAVKGWALPARVGAELQSSSVLCCMEGSVPRTRSFTGPAERRCPAPLGGTKSKPAEAGQKVACASHPSRPPAEEPRARLHLWVQSSSRHSSGGVLLTATHVDV